MTEYRHNHYVPEWYQGRFLPTGQANRELFRLDLQPGFLARPGGTIVRRRDVRRLGFRFCFAEDDLYTVALNGIDSTELERVFFGAIDSNGKNAVDYFEAFAHPYPGGGEALDHLLLYMSTQKFRTPKGLAWLMNFLESRDRNLVLDRVVKYRSIFGAIWAECCWQIADAFGSQTKFIVSDHPVTVYNRRCSPQSMWCRGVNDPDIRHHATHTIFPLSLERVLILTNLSWVRNPYQSPMGVRPNPVLGRSTMFFFNKIQTLRHLTEEEVRLINFIVKSRALRYVAAANEEWLYPERFVSRADWSHFGHGYLLMPDPRAVSLGGEIMWGGPRGGGAMDAYGRHPWDDDYNKEGTSLSEGRTLYRFQGEFARLFGRRRRGRCVDVGEFDAEEDSESMHEYYLSLDRPEAKK